MTENKSPEERIRSLESQLAFLAGAAYAVVLEANRIHDTEPWPVKYRAPFGTIANLAEILDSLDYLKEISAARAAARTVRDRLGADEDAP